MQFLVSGMAVLRWCADIRISVANHLVFRADAEMGAVTKLSPNHQRKCFGSEVHSIL